MAVRILRLQQDPQINNKNTVVFWVDFGEDVSNVSADDFALLGTATGVIGAPSLSSGGTTPNSAYELAVGASTDGTIGLRLKDGTDIRTVVGNAPLTGVSMDPGEYWTVDRVAPTVNSVSVPANGTYTTGQNLDFTVNYSEAMKIDSISSWPRIALTLDTGGTVYADYVSGNETSALLFRHTVAAGEIDLTGITVGTLSANGSLLTDVAGNTASLTLNSIGSTASVNVDTRPSVTSINRTGASASNASSLQYTVTFDRAVTGLDTNDFTLTSTGNAAGSIASVSGSGTTWTVTVDTVTGDGTLRLDLKSSGTGIEASGAPIIGGFTSGQTYTLDHTAPVVASVSVPANATYVAGQNLDFTVNFNEAVTVNTSGGTPQVGLTIGSTTRQASFLSGSGTSALVFRYTIQTDEIDADGVTVGALDPNSGTIRDAVGNNAVMTLNSVGATSNVRVDATVPTISSATGPTARAYKINDNLDFTVVFSEVVMVDTTGGTPTIGLTLDTGGSVQAAYVSGSGTDTLLFRYVVASGNLDANGITAATSISTNSGTIRDAAGNNAALSGLSITGLASVLVDGVAPAVQSINRVGAAVSKATTQSFTLTFAESVTGVDANDFVLTSTGSAAGSITGVTGSGTTYTVTVGSVTGTGDLRLDLKSSGTGITDAAGNAISGGYTSGQVIGIDNTAPAMPTIAMVAGNDVIAANEVSGLTLTGVAEAGSTVQVSLGGNVRTATLSGTTWTYAVTSADLTAMGAGAETISVTARDAVGNVSTAGTRAITVEAGAVPAPPTPVTPPSPPAPTLGDLANRPLSQALSTTLAATSIDPNSPKLSGGGTAAIISTTLSRVLAEFDAGRITVLQLETQLTDAMLPTTGVAHDVYRFFTGSAPTAAGMTYLIDSPNNPNDLTDPYYGVFTIQNRYINFAVNLGKIGEGRAAFEAKYGAMTFSEAVSTAYGEIIGFNNAQAGGVNIDAALRYIESQRAYFEALGGDAIGAKAAMVGYVISVGATFHIGTYYEGLKDHVVDSIVGGLSSSPIAGWDLA